MSIEKMELVNITGCFDSLDRVAALCLQSGCFQLESTDDYLKNLEGASRIVEENPFKQPLQRLRTIILSMGEQPGGEHTALSSVGVLGGIADYDADIAQIEEHIGSIQSQRETLMAEFSRLLSTEQQLEHFAGLDMDLHLAQHT